MKNWLAISEAIDDLTLTRVYFLAKANVLTAKLTFQLVENS